jgi:hypothetical protein
MSILYFATTAISFSMYDAAEKATRPWSLLWWYIPDATVTFVLCQKFERGNLLFLEGRADRD